MSNFSAIIPAADMDAANAILEAQGHGAGNFSVPIKTPAATAATRAGLHAWSDPVFLAHVEALADAGIPVSIEMGNGQPNFDEALSKRNLVKMERHEPDGPSTLPALGVERTRDGVVFVNQEDRNPWEPGTVKWAEKTAR
jgi:hypothetical protein